MGYEIKIDTWLEDAATLIRGIDVNSVADAAEGLLQVRDANGTMFLAGNGGSASTANHLALDLQKAGISPKGVRPKVISLSENGGVLPAGGNDDSFDVVFEKQLEAGGDEGGLKWS